MIPLDQGMVDPALLEKAWWTLHRDNLIAYNEGCAARGHDARNPYKRALSEDRFYWWREGFQGRPFSVFTDTEALSAFVLDSARGRTLRDKHARGGHYAHRPKPQAPPGPTAGKAAVQGTHIGVVHPTD